ncbi:hypothetical protein HN371_09415 [Candidatus Poribacteria bacterium]|nr:hypothetical protein [Candidatus Poribacteria bacterium]MBT5535888.1 hypothetical protein [Candidatus Poribacteria bacterium]MBT7099653.1 hypothetical protein [Candidatus Poribacteria bacterium]MBT7805223.1 hypothetical protein [Candidatus Poribacteria bacterium]
MNDNPTPDDNVEETPPDDNLADAPADDDAAAASSTDSSDGLDEGEHEDEHAAFEAAQAETARAELPMFVRTFGPRIGMANAELQWERITALWPFLRIVSWILVVIIIAGYLAFQFETRTTVPIDDDSVLTAAVRAGKQYARTDENGANVGVIVDKEDPFTTEIVAELKAAGHEELKLISHAMFDNLPDAMWWSVVTMTTVGYGDKFPTTPAARALAVLVMFMSLVLLASFTATFASAFVARQIQASQEQEDDPWEGHTIFCGWTEEGGPRVLQALDQGAAGRRLQVYFLNHLAEDAMELNLRGLSNIDTRFIRGDITREEDLDRAGLHAAANIVIIPDESDGTEPDDTRTIEATMAMKVLAPEVKVFAHAVSALRVANLHRAMVDDVVLTDSHTAEMLAAFVVRPGMTQAIHELLDPEESAEFATIDIPGRFAERPALELSDFLRRERNATLVGFVVEEEAFGLESAMEGGDAYMVEFIKEQIEEAGIEMAAEGAKTRVTINPSNDVAIAADAQALVIRERPARGA